MKDLIRRTAVLLLLLPVALFFTSCPQPITEELVAALEDDFQPSITVTSHSNNDYYYSELIITGVITDDALKSGDDKGTVSKLSFFADSGSLYSGGILIDSSGSITPDPDYGSAAVDYDTSSGAFTITMNSSGLDYNIDVEITATDLNGNTGENELTLRSSNGPAVEITSPAVNTYVGDDLITFAGTLSDSVDRTTTTDEIAEVGFQISTLGAETAMDLSDPAYEVSPGVYEMSIPQVSGPSSDEAVFRLDGTSFECVFYAPSSGMGSPRITVTALDLNGNSGIDYIDMTELEGGPSITVTEPNPSGNFYSSSLDKYYSSKDSSVYSGYLPYFAKVTKTAEVVTGVNIVTIDDGGTTTVVNDTTALTDGTRDYSPNISLSGLSGALRVRIEATDGVDTTTVTRNVAEDNAGPVFGGLTFTSTNGDPAYARGGETVSIAFSLSDAGVGVDASSLALWIGDSGQPIDLSSQNPGPYTATFSLPDQVDPAPAYNNGPVPFQLTAQDIFGSQTSRSESNIEVNYYHDAPVDAPTVTFTQSVGTNNTDDSYLRTDDTIRATFDVGRDLNIASSRMRFIVDGTARSWLSLSKDSPGIYSSGNYTILAGDTDGSIEWELEYADMAGNTATYDSGSSGYTATGLSVDNSPPTVTASEINSNDGTVPANSTVVTDGSRGRVYFNISDTGGSGISTSGATAPDVDFFIDGSPFPTLDTGTFSDATYDWRGRTDDLDSDDPQGAMTATIAIYDKAGNPATHNVPGSVTVDTVGPSITGTPSASPAAAGIGDTLSISFDLDEAQIDSEKPTVRLTASDSGNTVTVDSGDVSVGSDRTEWSVSYLIEDESGSPPILTGNITLEVAAKDIYGQSKTTLYASSTSIDNERPSVSAWSFSDGASGSVVSIGETLTCVITLSESVTASPSVTFTDGSTTIDFGDVSVSGSGTSWTAEFDIDEAGTGSPAFPAMDGNFRALVDITDNYGNTGSSNSQDDGENIDVDNVPPTVSITSPSEGDTFTTGTSQHLQASTTGADSVTFTLDGTDYTDSSLSSGNADVTVTMPSTAGSYTITAVATDDAGNTGSATPVGITVNSP